MSKTYHPSPIISVFIEHHENNIEPVSYELLGKARQLAREHHMKVYAVVMVKNSNEALNLEQVEKLVNHIDIYEYNREQEFTVLEYSDSFKMHIEQHKPMIALIAATAYGRNFAPRVAAYFKTGITADCTELEFDPKDGLIQTRPAYGGDVMARIITPNHFPQMATVRPFSFDMPKEMNKTPASSQVHLVNKVQNKIELIYKEFIEKQEIGIEESKIIVLAGNAIKTREELNLLKEFAASIQGDWAVTRPLVEGGLADHSRQVGVSGKIIRPELLIACGVSGSTQTLAGFIKSQKIIAINNNEKTTIFRYADLSILNDWKVIKTFKGE